MRPRNSRDAAWRAWQKLLRDEAGLKRRPQGIGEAIEEIGRMVPWWVIVVLLVVAVALWYVVLMGVTF